VAAAVAVGCLLALVSLTVAIHVGGPVLAVDSWVAAWVDGHRARALVLICQGVTWAGAFGIASPILLVVCVAVAGRTHAWRPLLIGLTGVAALAVTVGTGKQVVARSRIPFPVSSFGDGGTSYPSGHTTTAVVVAGVILLLAAPYLDRRTRRRALVAMVAYVGLISFTRVYLRQHWFSDVLAGWLLGSAIVCLLAVVFCRPPAVTGTGSVVRSESPNRSPDPSGWSPPADS
jgi:membrane-associated phospholipid phosphatase